VVVSESARVQALGEETRQAKGAAMAKPYQSARVLATDWRLATVLAQAWRSATAKA